MSTPPMNRDEFFDLCSAMCDGVASAEDVLRLEQSLANDPQSRDLYMQYAALHAGLKWSRSSASATVEEESPAPSSIACTQRRRWASLRQFVTRPVPISVTVAALVMGVLVTGMAIVAMPLVVNYARNGFDSRHTAPAIVAMLTNSQDAVWDEEQIGTRIGSHLLAGHRISLERGVAEVTFESGAVVWVEGPCEFRVVSASAASLQRGIVNARVNAAARGFELETPVAKVVDLGTAFGVRANAGGIDVQVFEGVVEVQVAEQNQRRTLRAGESLKVGSSGQVSPSASNMRIALPGLRVPLGNLFDDEKDIPLRRAVASNPFGATADPTDLGVHHMQAGTEDTVVALHEGIRLDLAELGWTNEWYSPPANDAWKPDDTGISTGSDIAQEKRRYEEGIGMHANQLITFDVHKIRAAGDFSMSSPLRLAIARMGVNRDPATTGTPNIHLIVVVSNASSVLGAWVNGQEIPVAQEGDFWQFTGELPAAMTPQSEYASLDEVLPADARFVTLICTGASDGIGADHGVFANCVLEILPEPLEKPDGGEAKISSPVEK